MTWETRPTTTCCRMRSLLRVLPEGQGDPQQVVGKSMGYGFVSFKDPWDMTKALREMHGKYIGNRPVKVRTCGVVKRREAIVAAVCMPTPSPEARTPLHSAACALRSQLPRHAVRCSQVRKSVEGPLDGRLKTTPALQLLARHLRKVVAQRAAAGAKPTHSGGSARQAIPKEQSQSRHGSGIRRSKAKDEARGCGCRLGSGIVEGRLRDPILTTQHPYRCLLAMQILTIVARVRPHCACSLDRVERCRERVLSAPMPTRSVE